MEIEYVLDRLSFTSPGFDYICYPMIANLSNTAKKLLLDIYIIVYGLMENTLETLIEL